MPELKKLRMSSSPHIVGRDCTRRIMLDVVIALIPALIAGTILFGLYAFFVVAICVVSAVFFEYLFNKIRKQPQTIQDLSAVVTGLILGLNLPPQVPFYVPIIGALFAIMLVKMLFGGLGKNFANPATTARIFLLLSWSSVMMTFINPIVYTGIADFFQFGGILSGNGIPVDVIASATPLMGGSASVLDLFLGRTAGCIGETSALALLIGGAYLLARRVIDWKIPVLVLGAAAVTTLLFHLDFALILPSLLSGGLMFGAFFMATDYATSPNTTLGTVIFALFIGFMTILLREVTKMPEGMSYAILLGNILVPLLDKFIIPKPFGAKRRKQA